MRTLIKNIKELVQVERQPRLRTQVLDFRFFG